MTRPDGEVFDRAADAFDVVGPRLFGPAGTWLVEVARPPSGARVLDVGCGTGAVALPAALAVGASGRVAAVDRAPGMIRRLQAEALRLGLRNIRASCGDAHDPPGRPGEYDVVTAGFVLSLLDRPDAAVARYAQLLAPGGRLAVTTFGPPDPRWRWLLRLHLAAQAERAARRGALDPASRAPAAALPGLLAAAGLRGICSRERTIRLTFTSADEWYAWSWSHGERAMWEALSPARRAIAREFAYARLNEMVERTGAAELAITVRCTVTERPGGYAPDAIGGRDDRTGLDGCAGSSP